MSIAEHIESEESARGTRKAKEELDKRMPVGSELVGGEGFITLELEGESRETGWDWILDHHPAVSPETHEIDESFPVEVGSWQMGYTVGMPSSRSSEARDLFRYKAKVRLRRPGQRLVNEKVTELSKLVRKRRAITPMETADGTWLVFCLADLQLGKADYGGTPVTVERVLNSIAELKAMAKKLKPAGICIVDLGDICEQVSCFYDSQTYTVDLNLTQQIDLAIELMLAAVDAVIDLTPRILIGAVPSNHGEFRVAKGTVVTDRARDNIDLVIVNSVKRIMNANPDRYGHVETWAPPLTGGDPYVLTLDLGGVMVGFTHGHQVKQMGVGRMAGLERWWFSDVWSNRKRLKSEKHPTGADCDILVCGHGHTMMISEQSGRLLVQAPASESGSEYFTTSTGKRSSAGVLTFHVHERWPMQANHFVVV